MEFSILGTNYNVIFDTEFSDNYDGYCDFTAKEIHIANMSRHEQKNLNYHIEKVIRHELIHAFLFESGLDVNSDWARNEEIVDWIALQFWKILEVFKAIEIPEKVY